MSNGWPVVPLGDLATTGISYGIVQPGAESPTGVPIVRVNNIRGGRIDTRDALRVSAEVEASFGRTRLEGGEVLLTLVGTLGECAVVSPELQGWNVARAVGVVRLRTELEAKWVSWVLRSPAAQHTMRTWATTTVQATLNLRDVAKLPIPLPPQNEMSAVAGVLGALDDKIELNRRMNETLEEIARALFKSWFVDFDPVQAKSEGRQPWGMDAETAALFPSEFEDSELGQIPKGWRVRPLDSIATFLNGLALQKFPSDGEDEFLPVIKIVELRKGSTEGADRASLAVPPPYVVEDGDLLFSWSGSLEVAVWTGGRGALNQHLFKVTSAEFPQWFAHQWLLQHLREFRGIAADKATTMGHIKRHHLTDALTVVPDASLLAAADATFSPLAQRWLVNRLESRTLAELRDTLLPKLMSGEVRVRDAERAVEAVG